MCRTIFCLLSLVGLDPKLPSPWILDLDSEQQQFHWKKVAENVFSSALLVFLVGFLLNGWWSRSFVVLNKPKKMIHYVLLRSRSVPQLFSQTETKRTKTSTLPKPRSNRRKLKWKDCWRKCTDFVTKYRNRVRSLIPRFSCGWKGLMGFKGAPPFFFFKRCVLIWPRCLGKMDAFLASGFLDCFLQSWICPNHIVFKWIQIIIFRGTNIIWEFWSHLPQLQRILGASVFVAWRLGPQAVYRESAVCDGLRRALMNSVSLACLGSTTSGDSHLIPVLGCHPKKTNSSFCRNNWGGFKQWQLSRSCVIF